MFYCHMLKQIREELFLPDLSRSGWMKFSSQFNIEKQLVRVNTKDDITPGSQGVTGGSKVTGVAQPESTDANGSDNEGARSCDSQYTTTEQMKVPTEIQQNESKASGNANENALEESARPVEIDVDSSDIESASSSSSTTSESAPIEELAPGKLAVKDKPQDHCFRIANLECYTNLAGIQQLWLVA